MRDCSCLPFFFHILVATCDRACWPAIPVASSSQHHVHLTNIDAVDHCFTNILHAYGALSSGASHVTGFCGSRITFRHLRCWTPGGKQVRVRRLEESSFIDVCSTITSLGHFCDSLNLTSPASSARNSKVPLGRHGRIKQKGSINGRAINENYQAQLKHGPGTSCKKTKIEAQPPQTVIERWRHDRCLEAKAGICHAIQLLRRCSHVGR